MNSSGLRLTLISLTLPDYLTSNQTEQPEIRGVPPSGFPLLNSTFTSRPTLTIQLAKRRSKGEGFFFFFSIQLENTQNGIDGMSNRILISFRNTTLLHPMIFKIFWMIQLPAECVTCGTFRILPRGECVTGMRDTKMFSVFRSSNG